MRTKLGVVLLLLVLSACSNETPYEPLKIEVYKNQKLPADVDQDPQINGIYEAIRDTKLFDSSDEGSSFIEVPEGSSLKILEEAEGGFVLVDYYGSQGYIAVKDIKEI